MADCEKCGGTGRVRCPLRVNGNPCQRLHDTPWLVPQDCPLGASGQDCSVPCTCADDGGGDGVEITYPNSILPGEVSILRHEVATLTCALEEKDKRIAELTRALEGERAKWAKLRKHVDSFIYQKHRDNETSCFHSRPEPFTLLRKMDALTHNMGGADRRCETCKHEKSDKGHGPCLFCERKWFSHWEPLSTLDRLDGGTGERKCGTCENWTWPSTPTHGDYGRYVRSHPAKCRVTGNLMGHDEKCNTARGPAWKALPDGHPGKPLDYTPRGKETP